MLLPDDARSGENRVQPKLLPSAQEHARIALRAREESEQLARFEGEGGLQATEPASFLRHAAEILNSKV